MDAANYDRGYNAVTSELDLQNILCVDVEEWYHPEYVRDRALENRESFAAKQTQTILHLLEYYNAKATFFVVGEIAETSPRLLKQITDYGHEIAFHGYYHNPLWTSNSKALRDEAVKFNSIALSATGYVCLGFRAPSYSLDNRTKWALKVLNDVGYVYDSSVFPIKTPLYGESSAPTIPYHPSPRNVTKIDDSETLIEFPALVYSIMGLRIPAAGGFYLRLLPLSLLRGAIRKTNRQGFPAVLSFHTWELDPQIPRLRLGLAKSFVTYHNLRTAANRLSRLLSEFKFTSFRDYLLKNCLIK